MVAQGFVLALTLVNVIYCFVTESLVCFDFTGYPLLYVPLYKFSHTHSLLDILAFVVFAFFSLFLYVKSLFEFLDNRLRKGWFVFINLLWLLFATLSCYPLCFDIDFVDFVFASEYKIGYSLFLLALIAVMVKTNEIQSVVRADRRDGEDFLPEEFQLDAKSYKQIERTAKGMPWLAFVSFVISLIILYIDGDKFISALCINLIYVGAALMMIANFFICIDQTKKFERKTGLTMPSEDFLKKINVLQITTFILFVASYFLLLIIGGASVLTLNF